MFRGIAAMFIVVAWPGLALSANSIAQFRDAMDYCAGKNMSSYDDGVSPANVVGKVLVGLCRRQNQGLYSLAVAGRSSAYVGAFNHANEEEFTGLVLFHRANKSGASK